MGMAGLEAQPGSILVWLAQLDHHPSGRTRKVKQKTDVPQDTLPRSKRDLRSLDSGSGRVDRSGNLFRDSLHLQES